MSKKEDPKNSARTTEGIAKLPSLDSSQPVEAEVIVAGHICLDVIPTLMGDTVSFVPGQTIKAGSMIFTTGAVSNTGLALHKLGVPTKLMGKVGSDLFGQLILQILESHGSGLSNGVVVVPGESSSYSIILSPPDVDRILVHSPGCNAMFGADDVCYEVLKSIRLFHFGYPPLMERMYSANGAELTAMFQHAKEMGVTTSLDLSMPDPDSLAAHADWHTIFSATLESVDIFLPSVGELLLMLHRPVFDRLTIRSGNRNLLAQVTPEMISELGQELLNMGAKIIGLKAGDQGMYLRTANVATLAQIDRSLITDLTAWSNRELWMPCFATQVAGTAGSGDATIAGFLMGLLRRMTPEAALSAACAVGACNVEAIDALSGLRGWPETAARIASGWSHLALAHDMTNSGWHWSEIQGVWIGPNDSHR